MGTTVGVGPPVIMNRTWTVVGYFGAAVLSAVSLIANLRYGLSLARHPLDQATYASASVAIDLLKDTCCRS